MKKVKKKQKIAMKVCACFLYTLSVICICSGLLGMAVINTKDLKAKESINNNITKSVTSKEITTSVQTITKRLEEEAAAKAAAEAAAKKAAEEAARQRAIEAASPKVDYTKSEYQSYAHDLVINTYGWTEADFEALVKLWNRESGWNANSHNSYTGAHGIPQALPASKMSSEGSDYYTNGKTQIRWGLKYISNRYGSASSAWTFFQNNGWY